MILQVMFRDVYKKDFTTGPYTYKCDIRNVKVGDIAIVETRYGLSIAQIHKLNLKLVNPLELSQLKNVLEICATKYPLPGEVKDGQDKS